MNKETKLAAKPAKPKVISVRMDAAFFFERAVQSMDRFHYDKALKYFRRAAEYEPENPVNHCNMAGILSELGNYEESNRILHNILAEIDPTMTECYFYMANNYANMEHFEAAERELIRYLERDEEGQYLEEAEEMMEYLSFELERPAKKAVIKSRQGLNEHDRARALLEEGKFGEAVRVLEKLIEQHTDFMAARNNLALAYYYMGYFEKSIEAIHTVLEMEPGNLHALCNLAIFYQHMDRKDELAELTYLLKKTYPFHQEHVFKLATTMGILGEHETAYRHFRRLLKDGEAYGDPSLHHYTAVAACNIGRYDDAARHWLQTQKLDPQSEIPRFFMSQLQKIRLEETKCPLNYHYHLPFEEQFQLLERSKDGIPDHMKRDPLVRSSFFWALRHGDHETKLQVIQALGMLADGEVKDALRAFILEPDEDEYLKKVAIFVLRTIGMKEPIHAHLEGKPTVVHAMTLSPNLPVWEEQWQSVMEMALSKMDKRYDMVQQHDLQTLWVEYLSRVYPNVPKVGKKEGWAAALEYLTAKMHRRTISYHEVATIYGASITTISKYVKLMDEACGIREKMEAIFRKFNEKL
ncbi:tetratricopeptide repeat protein [Paenibacillus gansuensis]|uniref:Tetratricopeptide repeat protein n=1 Tax=Paenibacillus gansuensis TaxID=306542 RepID=A0ABW5PHM6_9BACL